MHSPHFTLAGPGAVASIAQRLGDQRPGRVSSSESSADVRRLRLRAVDDGALWDRLVRASPAAVAFHDWAFLDLVEQILRGRVERLAVYSGETPIGVFPVARRAAPSARRLGVPFPLLGPLVPAQSLEGTLRAYRRHQALHGPVLTEVDLGPQACEEALEQILAAGCRAHDFTTVEVDLSHGSVDTLRSGFSSMRRRAIKRAVRDGATVREALPGELTSLLPRVLDEAYTARGASNPYPADFGRLLEEWVSGRDDVAVFTGLVDGEPAGMQVVMAGHPTAVYWVGATLRRFRSVDVSALLYQRIIEWSLERGCDRIDLCGSVDEGVLRYKLSFGGVESPYFMVASSAVPPRVLDTARSVLGRLPH